MAKSYRAIARPIILIGLLSSIVYSYAPAQSTSGPTETQGESSRPTEIKINGTKEATTDLEDTEKTQDVANSDKTGAKNTPPCSPRLLYNNLLSTNLAEETQDSFCLRLDNTLVVLWYIGCPPCIFEFQELIFPAAARDPSLRGRLVSGFVVDEIETSRELITSAQKTLRNIPDHKTIKHLIIEKGNNPIWLALNSEYQKGRRESYPSFLHFENNKHVFIQTSDTEKIKRFAESGKYTDAIRHFLRKPSP